MSILGNDLLLGSGDEGYNLTRSLRFRQSATAYLSRTFTSTGNRQIWTWSGWVKRGALSSGTLFGADGSNYAFIYFSPNSLDCGEVVSSQQWRRVTTQVFRDPSAWYHVVFAFDSTQATAGNRIKLYVNGSQVTAFSTSADPTLNYNSIVNTTIAHSIGSFAAPTRQAYLDGYLTEVNFIDGQALTPSSFGSTNTLTGVWQPARYTGTYGTNGFYLPFTDNSTAAALGTDFSGNSNTWTVNNISITSGTTYDSMTDVPTLTSATAANFAVLNPLNGNPATGSLSDGNLTGLSSSAGEGYWNSTIAIPSSGKWYWEFQFTTGGNGIRTAVTTTSMGTYSLLLNEAGRLYVNGVDQGIVASGYSGTDIMGVSVDVSTTTIKWYKNNTLNYTYTYTAQSLPLFAFGGKYSNPCYFNFGQRPFTYTPPTGFVALNTFNLPTSTIVKGNTVMDATLWTGTGSNPQVITNAAGFKPDLVWLKARSFNTYNQLADSIRGANKSLYSNTTDPEDTNAINGYQTVFSSNGFSVTAGSNSGAAVNGSGTTYVGWQWQAGQGSTSSNTNGTITSTVSVNASAGFSVVSFAVPATTSSYTIGHGLGVAPSLIFVKGRDKVDSWVIYHSSVSTNTSSYLVLNSTSALLSLANMWGTALPTSSVFGITANTTIANDQNVIAYCWTPIAGYSAFGSYTGNGSSDGAFVFTGFQPKWVMIKRTDSGNNWFILDTARNTYNLSNAQLLPNSSAAESTNTDCNIDILSNGFKLRTALDASNGSGGTYIYAAFAANPFKNSLAR